VTACNGAKRRERLDTVFDGKRSETDGSFTVFIAESEVFAFVM